MSRHTETVVTNVAATDVTNVPESPTSDGGRPKREDLLDINFKTFTEWMLMRWCTQNADGITADEFKRIQIILIASAGLQCKESGKQRSKQKSKERMNNCITTFAPKRLWASLQMAERECAGVKIPPGLNEEKLKWTTLGTGESYVELHIYAGLRA